MIEHNKDITSLTTFGIPVKARYYAEYSSEEELLKLSRTQEFLNNEVFNLGGGSNLLFLQDFDGLVLHSQIKGITRYDKCPGTTYVIAGAGVVWNDLVKWCIDNNLGGLENMIGIPGSVGASAVQNVGAYGVEAEDVIYSVECFDTLTRKSKRFTNQECQFAYRDSFFKHAGKERYIVMRVCFKVTDSAIARNLEYSPLNNLTERLGHAPSIKEVAEEVMTLRNAKLPDPSIVGSAGSFFKNPVISIYHYNELCNQLGTDINAHKVDDHSMKLSAAWLIDHAGMKGCRVGDAVVWENQPLVIANLGNASSNDVKTLANMVRDAVRTKFNINLCPEVNYIDTSITVTVLGSGTSKGVPEVGCDCEVCRSDDKKDKRLRASVLVQTQGMNLLIDASADFRQQALNERIYDLTAVLITHSHYDHVGGIDDLRPYCAYGNIPLYVRKDVDDDLRRRLDYCFLPHLYPGVPTFDMKIIDNYPFYINGLKIEPIEVIHGKKPIFGYRIGKFAYITDAKYINEKEKEKLYGLDILIVNTLRKREHFAHFSLQEALQLISEVKPKQAYLTHISHELGLYKDVEKELPPNVHQCYDGLKLLC